MCLAGPYLRMFLTEHAAAEFERSDQLSFREFYDEYERLVTGARDGKLMPDEYMGANLTLTNPGTLGTVASVPRLMLGQGSILATGAIRAVAGDRTMTITSTYDHRIIQGAESGLFLREIDLLLQGQEEIYQQVAVAMGVRRRLEGEEGESGKGDDAAAERVISVSSPSPSSPGEVGGVATGRDLLTYIASAMSLVSAYRTHGYLNAKLDPLGTDPIGDPAHRMREVDHRAGLAVLQIDIGRELAFEYRLDDEGGLAGNRGFGKAAGSLAGHPFAQARAGRLVDQRQPGG